MTLLEQYQALPEEPEPFMKPPRRFSDIVDYQEQQIARRDALIRLLAKALRKYGIDPHIDGPCGDKDCDYCNAQAELRALLAAVERDFPKE